MVHIVLREDGWFEAGKDADNTSFIPLIYTAKQELLGDLEAIGEQTNMEELKKELAGISGGFSFKGSPYLQADKVYIDTKGQPGRCYLGKIEE